MSQQPPPPPPPVYGSQPYAVHQPYQHPPSPSNGMSPKAGSFGFLPSSLGTPHVNALMWNRSSPAEVRAGSGNWRQNQMSPPTYPHSGNASVQEVHLVPTRPLLKALAKECRPSPPWSVGYVVPNSLSDELFQFMQFLSPTADETRRAAESKQRIDELISAVWPSSTLMPMGPDAAGVPLTKEGTSHMYAPGSTIGENLESIKAKIRSTALEFGFQTDFGVDYRGIDTVILTEARSGEKVSVRFGEKCEAIATSSKILEDHIQLVPNRRSVLVALDALLRQNKLLDDTGVNTALLSCEAVAMMLLSIAHSYAADDTPDSGRLLNDFFLTFGFTAHFDCSTNSIVYSGMVTPVAKVHRESQLSVIDPSNETANLTSKVDKVAHLLAVFNYCYTASSQFTQVSPQQRRAQSILSTMIGGETYWSRVLSLFHQHVSPFHEVVNDKKFRLAMQMN